MLRMLWTQKLSDDKLKNILDKVDDLQIAGVTGDEELRNLAETWYDNSVGMNGLWHYLLMFGRKQRLGGEISRRNVIL